jgi:sugar (pentulose or hexulose) kinase
MGAGVFPDIRKSLLEMVKLERRFEPILANHERYMKSYKVFRDIYEHLKNDFDHLANVTL